MKKKSEQIRKVLSSMFKVGMIGFGGGSALIPVIEREVVEDNEVVTKEEYDKDVIVASITPGALPVEIAGGVGKKVFGSFGMAASAIMMALPGVILTLVLLSVLSGANAGILLQIQYAAVGVTAFISCMLTEYIRGVVAENRKVKNGLKTGIMILVVLALTVGKNLYRLLQTDNTPLLSLSTLNVLIMAFFFIIVTGVGEKKTKRMRQIICGIICILYVMCVAKTPLIESKKVLYGLWCAMAVLTIYSVYKSLKKGEKTSDVSIKSLLKDLGVCVLIVVVTAIPALLLTSSSAQYILNGLISSILSFGGGDAYLTVADGLFVDPGIISEDMFYGTVVSVVNVLPGSILCKTLSGIGYCIGYATFENVGAGLLIALAGFGCSIAASCGVFALVEYIYEKFETIDVFRLIKKWTRPIVSGLLLTVMASLIYQNMKLGVSLNNTYLYIGYMAIIYILNLVLFYKLKKRNSLIAGCSIVISLLLCNLNFL